MALVGQPDGRYRGHAEIGPVGQSGYETGGKHHPVGWRDGAEHRSQQHHGGQYEQYALRTVLVGHRQQRGAAAHSDGVSRDKVACLDDCYAQSARYVGQDAHHYKFRHAQG